jgi:hypothetical protein
MTAEFGSDLPGRVDGGPLDGNTFHFPGGDGGVRGVVVSVNIAGAWHVYRLVPFTDFNDPINHLKYLGEQTRPLSIDPADRPEPE